MATILSDLPYPVMPTWLSMPGSIATTIETPFSEAADAWIEAHSVLPAAYAGQRPRRFIRATTEASYRQYVGSLKLFFGTMRMRDIRLDHIARYQRQRLSGAPPFIRKRRPHDKEAGPCPVSAKKVNQELGLLTRIMKSAHAWTDELNELYEPLIEEIAEAARALRPEQQRHWLDVARSESRWNVIHWYSLLAFDTCMSTNEIRAVQLGDINLQQRRITISREGSKNKYRQRAIEIASEFAMWALECLIRRANEQGSFDTHHYLFPWRTAPGIYDPSKPMSESGIKKGWEEVRMASKLKWFRQYDCRHTAITRLAEAGVPIAIIKKRAGHVSDKMTDHYTHISDETQVRAVRMAQQYNGGLGQEGYRPYGGMLHAPEPARPSLLPTATFYSAPAEPQTPPADMLGQMLRMMQDQFGVTPDQLRRALGPSEAPASNITMFPGPRR